MTTPPHWDADSAVAPLPLRPWTGIVWRSHGIDLTGSRRAGTRVYYAPTSDGGSRRTSGRYHRAPDLYPGQQVWPALYTSLTDGGCLAEGILVPAASLLGTNLVILTENLRPGSVVDVLESIDPRLRRPTT
jgi:hypothetical protein